MHERELSVLERLYAMLALRLRELRLPLLSGLAAGLLAHVFAFTNKLLNADEIWSLFERGATVTSGRWGLELSKWIFPSVSMPWIYGVLSLLLLSLAAALTVRIFSIRSRCLQALLAAVFVSFPSVTGLFCFMFTSAPYALAFLLAVLAVYLTERGGRLRWALAFVLLLLSVGTYQAYVAVAASFFVLRMIQRLLREEGTAGEILRYGLYRLALLAAVLLAYYAASLLALRLTGERFSEYGVVGRSGFFYRFALAYSAFLHTFTRGYFAFVNSRLSLIMHGLLLLTTASLLLRWLLEGRGAARTALMLLCLLLFPLSVYCIYLIAETDIIHSLVLYSFVSVYLLAAIAADDARAHAGRRGRDALILALTLILAGNVFFANKVYLKMHLQYEQAYAICTSIVTRVEQAEGFDADKKLAIVGDGSGLGRSFEQLDTAGLMGPNENLIQIYTRNIFLQRYLGFDVPFATIDECYTLSRDARVQAMPCYPYAGCVQVVDGFVVVRLS